jgi:hypothetical protein
MGLSEIERATLTITSIFLFKKQSKGQTRSTCARKKQGGLPFTRESRIERSQKHASDPTAFSSSALVSLLSQSARTATPINAHTGARRYTASLAQYTSFQYVAHFTLILV